MMTKLLLKEYTAQMKFSIQLFFVAALLLCLSGCAADYRGMGLPWMSGNTGVVTRDPESLPDIAWQTRNQRQSLIRQNDMILEEQRQLPERPGLETILGGSMASPEPRKVAVALLLPLTGKSADLGQAMLKAAQMALFDIGSTSFELIPKDTKSTKEGAVAAAQGAVAGRADLILGPIFADDLKAIRPVTEPSGTPVISFTTDWTQAGGNTYVMGFLPFAQVARVSRYAQFQGLGRFAVYAPQTEYCDVVISTLQRTGARIVKVDRYSSLQTDLSELIDDFVAMSKPDGAGKSAPPGFDALVLPVGGESLKSLVSLFRLQGVSGDNVRLIGTGLWDDPALAQDPDLYGAWFAAPDPVSRADFERRYSDNYGGLPPRLASLAYDATALAAVLARTGYGTPHPYSRDRITNPRGFAGVDGIFRFRPDGMAERGLAVLEIQSGGARVIDPAPTAFISSGS
jgi:branched-chain amino acid transport system substrate-binding protein